MILISQLGSVVWYPATGLVFGLLLGISPWYAILVSLSGALAGRLIYSQPLSTFGETIGAIAGSIFYAIAACELRGPLKIDLELRKRRDVVLYVSLTTLAALASTFGGVLCLAADHSIRWNEFWPAALGWFLGDEIGLLGIAPFLLIHVCPWIRRQLATATTSELDGPKRQHSNRTLYGLLEGLGQIVTIMFVLWIIFGAGLEHMLYLSFIPVVWVALRQGMRRVVSCLLLLNFGIATALYLFPQPPSLFPRTGLLMFMVSTVGLIVGALVSERHRIAKELLERSTELLQANTQLVAATIKAEDASRIKSEFLANMSHEIRTPINGILGMTELMLNTELTNGQREYLSLLKSSGDSLLVIINDILDFSKIESGKLTLESIEFNIQDLVAETVTVLAPRAHDKGLELACEVDPEMPAHLMGDPGRLRQVITNLVGNAIKFTHEGEVIVRAKMDGKREGELDLHVAVTDTGIGIPGDKLAMVFESFAQADSSTTRQYGGTGLGLAICSRLVSAMGGRISLESIPGKGSTFHFLVPLEISDHQPAVVPANPGIMNVPILIVDDNLSNRQILLELTSAIGMATVAVESGKQALELLQQRQAVGSPFRLVLIDDAMPEMDGLELARRIRSGGSCPSDVLMMGTAGRQCSHLDICRQFGIRGYLLKPIRKSKLIAAVTSALGLAPANVSEAKLEETETQNWSRSLRILVAEDNPINQIVIVRLLELLGHVPAIASDGKKALAMLEKDKYDCVFMDVQMPEFDGLETTREIRKRESRTGQHLPIIAMTAYAMKGDKQRCFTAGMNAYMAKPINRHDIEMMLARFFPSASRAGVCNQLKHAVRSAEWDMSVALARVEGDRTLLSELVRIFLDESPRELHALREAIARGECEVIHRVAHTLKGELSYMGIVEAARVAKELEQAGKEQDLTRAKELLSQITVHISAVTQTMQLQLSAMAGETGPIPVNLSDR